MSTAIDVMLDLETMGSGPSAAIVAIGAVEFSALNGTIGRKFYRVVDLDTAVRWGGVIDAATVMWWLRQSDVARGALNAEGMPLVRALVEFTDWLMGCGDGVKVRGNGAAFDNVILASAYRRADMVVPWQHRNDRCYRTVKAMCPDVKMERAGTHHNALDDAISQAQHLIEVLRALRGAPAEKLGAGETVAEVAP